MVDRIDNYTRFLSELEERGCIPLSSDVPGIPGMILLCPDYLWHTGDPDSDPWMYRTRLPFEKKGAYGCLAGGKKVFIAASFFPVAYAACRIPFSMEERYEAGLTSGDVYTMYNLFRKRRVLSTFQVREYLQGEMKASAQDKALMLLQSQWELTVMDSVQKRNKAGAPYGWHVNLYGCLEDWAPVDWQEAADALPQQQARQQWMEKCEELYPCFDRTAFCRTMGWESMGTEGRRS